MNGEILQKLLSTNLLVKRFYLYPEIDSTMNQARRLVAADKVEHYHGTLLVADHQVDGRGRHGRTWSAPSGTSLLATLIIARSCLPGQADARQLSLVSSAIPVAVCKGVGEFLPAARIKYPNDIVVEGRKLGGILLETSGGAMFAGFGVNCLQELDNLPADSRMPASSLWLETGRRISREAVLVAIMDEMESILGESAFMSAGEEMCKLCETLGRTICIDTGREVLMGVAHSITADGMLLLETASGAHCIYSADVVRTWFSEAGV